MELSQRNLEEALRLLGNLLHTRKGAWFWLVVCGGSALLAQEIISRSIFYSITPDCASSLNPALKIAGAPPVGMA